MRPKYAMPRQATTPLPTRLVRTRVRRFIREHDLVRPGERILAGVSGGPDSTCLLLSLAELRSSLRFDLEVAYFDHKLRGPRAAAREVRFVRTLAEALNVPLHCGAGDVRAHARSRHRSQEEAARELRYRFLAETAAASACGAVAVGHTKDDQAETVLIHLLRGSGLRGLAAMSPSTSWPFAGAGEALRLIRPLLSLSRQETERCCNEAGLAPVRDPSNRSRAYLRNRVRRELLPLLRRYNPNVEAALLRLSSAAADDIALLEELAASALDEERSDAESVHLQRGSLAALPAALQRHGIRLAVARLLGDGRDLSDRHVRAILQANERGSGSHLDLPRGLSADVTREAIVLSTKPPSRVDALPERAASLPVPGKTTFGPWRIEAKLLTRRPPKLRSGRDPHIAFLDAEALGEQLGLRRRRPGDRFQPLGLDRPKKLQDFFVDAHVPRAERDAVPLLYGERGIAWVVGQRIAEWAKVRTITRRILRVVVRPARA